MKIALSAPFSALMTLSEDGSSYTFDADSKRLLEQVASDLERQGELFSAHRVDQWGEAKWGSFVERDLSYATNTDATICLLLADDQGLFIESPGTYCELGAALAVGKAVVFLKKRGVEINPSSFFVKELITLHPVYELNDDYSLPTEAIDFLQTQVKIIRTAVEETFKEHHLLGDHSIVTSDGLKLMIRKGTLSPKLSAGSSFVIDYISQMSLSNEKVIDIGSGSGVIALSLKKRFPKLEMTALDISTPAIESLKENAAHNRLEIEVIQSDSLSQLKSSKKYDLALLAAPYHDAPEPTDADPLWFTCFDEGHRFTKSVLAGAAEILNPNGRLVILLADLSETVHNFPSWESPGLQLFAVKTIRPSMPGGHVRFLVEWRRV